MHIYYHYFDRDSVLKMDVSKPYSEMIVAPAQKKVLKE